MIDNLMTRLCPTPKAAKTLIALLIGSVIALANCGKPSDDPSGNPSSYPGNFLALCQQQDKSAELAKSFKILLQENESCMDGYSRLMALDQIDLSGTGIADIRPLASFIGVKTLYLDHNRIGSLEPLEALIKLEKLDVSWNAIADVSALHKLTRLETLYVFGNPLGNDVAKTADNCPYADVGAGLTKFCQPPKRKKPKVIVIKKPKTSQTDKQSRKKKRDRTPTKSSSDDSSSDQSSSDPSSTDQSSDSEDSSDNSSASDSKTSRDRQKPAKRQKAEQDDGSESADPDARPKRAWEKDPSFLPPEQDDDNDDWGRESEENGERGLAPEPDEDEANAADPKAKVGDKTIDAEMKKEADKTLGSAENKPKDKAENGENPFAEEGSPQAAVAGKQTTAHSWDQAIGRAFDKPSDGAKSASGLDPKQSHLDLDLDMDLDVLGADSPGRRVDAGEVFGPEGEPGASPDESLLGSLTKLYPRPSGQKDESPSSGFWTTRLFKQLSLSLGGDKKTVPQAKAPEAKTTVAKNAAKKAAKPQGKAQMTKVPVQPTVASPAREAKAPIKSFLAYCLDHSDQPAIAHTIKVLTYKGETCIDSYRRLSSLKELNLKKSQLTDISPLASFKNLEKLDLSSNKITDLRPLTGLQKLRWLNLDNNNLGDISHLGRLAALSHLTAKYNRIFSLKPLGQLKNLGTIAVKGNPIATDAVKNSLTCPVSAASSSLTRFCQL